jgi:hypothetical protein
MAAPSLYISDKKFTLSVTIIAGAGDGTLIYRDASGHIHVVPDPRPLDSAVTKAIKSIEAGIAEFQAATAKLNAHH